MATKVKSTSAPSLTLAQRKSEMQWQAQEDLRTLQRAQEIQSSPARVKAAQQEAQSQIAALGSVAKKK
jgi:hypothetical protein